MGKLRTGKLRSLHPVVQTCHLLVEPIPADPTQRREWWFWIRKRTLDTYISSHLNGLGEDVGSERRPVDVLSFVLMSSLEHRSWGKVCRKETRKKFGNQHGNLECFLSFSPPVCFNVSCVAEVNLLLRRKRRRRVRIRFCCNDVCLVPPARR